MLTCREEDKYNQKYTQDKRWKLRAAGGKSASSTHAQDFTANLELKRPNKSIPDVILDLNSLFFELSTTPNLTVAKKEQA